MKYNSQQEQIRIAAYGRRVQEMVEYAIGLQDRDERNSCAHTIIRVMADLRADEKNEPNFEQKLWDHLACISGYRLDIDYPVEINRVDESNAVHPTLSYPDKEIRQRQYGALLEESLQRCAEMPEGPERDETLALIANQMKRALFLWNPGAMSDQKVMADIEQLSGGRLHLPEDFRFANPTERFTQGRNVVFSQMRGGGKKKKGK